jgi:uncharacterized protein (TIGR00251 family)
MTSPPSARIQVRVYPNASRNEITGYNQGVLHLKIAAPPVKGKANQELASFVSRLLKISKGSVSIVKGHTSKNKLVAIEGLDQQTIIKRLAPQQDRLL